MKLFLAFLAALAASVTATPIRVITLTGDTSNNLHALENLPPNEIHVDIPHTPHHRPCNKAKVMTGPLGALLSRLGLGPPHHASQVLDRNGMGDAWKHHVEEIMREAESKIVPFMEGGVVRILPVMDDEGKPDAHRHPGNWEGHAHGPSPHRFGARLHKALLHLTPTESITMAFVLGAGIGSILHFIFMIFILTIRLFRCNRTTWAERRAGRKARRAARRAVRREGRVRLEGEEAEVLPSYAEGETAKLVEKA